MKKGRPAVSTRNDKANGHCGRSKQKMFELNPDIDYIAELKAHYSMGVSLPHCTHRLYLLNSESLLQTSFNCHNVNAWSLSDEKGLDRRSG